MSEREGKIKIKHSADSDNEIYKQPTSVPGLEQASSGGCTRSGKVGVDSIRGFIYQDTSPLPPRNKSMAKEKRDAAAGRKHLLGSFVRLAPLRTS